MLYRKNVGTVDFSSRRQDDLRANVVRALESLPESHREVVVMRDFEELTIGEMAARLSLTREATKSRLHRARALVREYTRRRRSRVMSPFASKTLAHHLLRGGAAVGLIALAIELNDDLPALAMVAGIAAIVALRGCPMCWTVGLFETLRAK